MANDPERLLFRMQHIIPPSLSHAATLTGNATNVPKEDSSLHNAPREVNFIMTWGKIAGKEWGPTDGHPVLALHGWLDNAGSYDKLIPLLPKDLHIVVVETPGHGLSDPYPPDLAYNALDSVIAIERLRRQLKWQKFSIIGHSMGGVCAMLYAGIFPERLEKVVMLDIARVQITLSETVDARLRKTVGKLLKYEEAIIAGQEKPISYEEAVQKAIEGSFGSLNEEACDIMFKRGLKKVEGGYIFRRDRRLLAAPLGFYPKADQLELARKVTADVLLIKYKDGPIFEPMENFMEHVEALKTSSKNVRFVQVDGSHHAHLTHPERVAPIISEFFRL